MLNLSYQFPGVAKATPTTRFTKQQFVPFKVKKALKEQITVSDSYRKRPGKEFLVLKTDVMFKLATLIYTLMITQKKVLFLLLVKESFQTRTTSTPVKCVTSPILMPVTCTTPA